MAVDIKMDGQVLSKREWKAGLYGFAVGGVVGTVLMMVL